MWRGGISVFMCVFTLTLTTVSSFKNDVSLLPWMTDNAVDHPGQMVYVHFPNNDTPSIFFTGDNFLYRVDNISSGPASTVRGARKARGLIAIPNTFRLSPTVRTFTKGLFYTTQDADFLGHVWYLPVGASEPVEVFNDANFKEPYYSSHAFHWGSMIRFFVPQYDAYCVSLVSTQTGAVNQSDGSVLYSGEALSVEAAAGECNIPQGFCDKDGAAQTEACVGVPHSVVLSMAAMSIYISDLQFSCLRRCAPISVNGSTADAFCTKLLSVTGQDFGLEGMENCGGGWGLSVLPLTEGNQFPILLWGVWNETGNYQLLRVVDDPLNRVPVEFTSIAPLSDYMRDTLLLTDGRLLISQSSLLKDALVVLNGSFVSTSSSTVTESITTKSESSSVSKTITPPKTSTQTFSSSFSSKTAHTFTLTNTNVTKSESLLESASATETLPTSETVEVSLSTLTISLLTPTITRLASFSKTLQLSSTELETNTVTLTETTMSFGMSYTSTMSANVTATNTMLTTNTESATGTSTHIETKTATASVTRTHSCALVDVLWRSVNESVQLYDVLRYGINITLILSSPVHLPIIPERVFLSWGKLETVVARSERVVELHLLPPDVVSLLQPVALVVAINPSAFRCQPTGELKASVLLKAVELPTPKPLRDAFTATSVVGGALAVGGLAPSLVYSLSRSTAMFRLTACEFSHSEALPANLSPLGLHFGLPQGMFYRGAVVWNLGMLLGAMGGIYLFGIAKNTYLHTSKRSTETVDETFRNLHLPGFLILPCAFFIPSLVSVSTSLAFHGGSQMDGILAGISLALSAIIYFFVLYVVVLRFSAKASRVKLDRDPSENIRRKFYRWFCLFYSSDMKWVDTNDEDGFSKKYGSLFAMYRKEFYWAMGVELFVAVGSAVVEGARPNSSSGCELAAWSATAFAVVNSLLLVVLRPYASGFFTCYFAIVSLMALGSCVALLIGEDELCDKLSMIVIVASTLTSALDVVLLLASLPAKYSRAELKQKIVSLLKRVHRRRGEEEEESPSLQYIMRQTEHQQQQQNEEDLMCAKEELRQALVTAAQEGIDVAHLRQRSNSCNGASSSRLLEVPLQRDATPIENDLSIPVVVAATPSNVEQNEWSEGQLQIHRVIAPPGRRSVGTFSNFNLMGATHEVQPTSTIRSEQEEGHSSCGTTSKVVRENRWLPEPTGGGQLEGGLPSRSRLSPPDRAKRTAERKSRMAMWAVAYQLLASDGDQHRGNPNSTTQNQLA